MVIKIINQSSIILNHWLFGRGCTAHQKSQKIYKIPYFPR